MGKPSTSVRKGPHPTRVRFTVQADPAWTAHAIARHKRRYRTLRNPLDAWLAYDLSRRAGRAVPPWVLVYLDRSAEQFWWLVQRAETRDEIPPDPAAAIAAALEMKAPGKSGAGNVFSRYADSRHRDLASRIGLALHHRGKLYLAVEDVISTTHAKKSTLYRAWKKHGADWTSLSDKAARGLAMLLDAQDRRRSKAPGPQ